MKFIFVSSYILVSWCDQSDNSGYEKNEWFVSVRLFWSNEEGGEKEVALLKYVIIKIKDEGLTSKLMHQ